MSLEHQTRRKPLKIWVILTADRVTVSLNILYTANQETEGSKDRFTRLGTSCLGRPPGDVLYASEAMRVLHCTSELSPTFSQLPSIATNHWDLNRTFTHLFIKFQGNSGV